MKLLAALLPVALSLVFAGCRAANPHLAASVPSRTEMQSDDITARPASTTSRQEEAGPADPVKTNPYLGHGRNNRASVLAATTFENDESDLTFGFEYERWMGPEWGVGGLVDFFNGDIDRTLIAGSVIYHPIHSLGLQVSPGVAVLDGSSNLLAVRTGMFYDFPLGVSFSFGPKLYIDFLEGGGRSSVLGISFNVHF